MNRISLYTQKWYRIAKFNKSDVNAFILDLNTSYANKPPMNILCSITSTYTTAHITILNSVNLLNNYHIPKIRVQYNSNDNMFYVDVYYKEINLLNSLYVTILAETDSLVMLTDTATTEYTTVDEYILNEGIVSNTNGTAYKREDGTMIAFGTKTISASYGTIQFPLAFISSPSVVVSLVATSSTDSVYIVSNGISSLSSCNVFAQKNDASAVTSEINIAWQAIGKWK